jgi:phytanoyl-CoA hydroxylase
MAAVPSADADTLRAPFEEQGYVILKGFLAPEVLTAARSEMEALVERQAEQLLAAGKITDPLRDAPFETRLAGLYAGCLDDAPKSFRRDLHLPGLFGVFFHPRLLDIVATFLGEEIRLYPNYTARPKLPEWKGTEVLWHQDGGYTRAEQVAALRMLNVWAPLVPARVENGCMQFIPGTHRLGVVPHEQRQYYLEIARDYLAPREDRAVNIEMDPGDVVLFHNLLFHRGLPNHSPGIRWSLDWRYQDATQPTMREHHGHIARSRAHPDRAVISAEAWARLTFV